MRNIKEVNERWAFWEVYLTVFQRLDFYKTRILVMFFLTGSVPPKLALYGRHPLSFDIFHLAHIIIRSYSIIAATFSLVKMMHSSSLSLLLTVVITYASLMRVTESSNTASLLTTERVDAFHEWIDVHGKEYETNFEMTLRLMTWAENDGKLKFDE